MTTGIYAIVNRTTGDRYVGQSVNIEKRWAEHRRALTSGRASSPALQEAWNSYGEATFDFRILERCEPEDLDQREQSHMLKGSSLNRVTQYVEPLAIERELGIDPNELEVDLNQMLEDLLSEDAEAAISSPDELWQTLEEMLRLNTKIAALLEAAEPYVLNSELHDDRLIETLWEKTADGVHGVSGAIPEILRRMDQLKV
ncbi:GIY-YIG nuclease family protein [Leisingera sp. XS_AS12]|uniref:GIY-YIG nuclease family protein n=1 Tax=Leisingera sp. XS_AS12 TaxID=3241294 RepID=UPI003516D908